MASLADYSEAGICNASLRYLGVEPITALSDDTVEARQCRDAYPRLRDFLLKSHPWNFAIGRARLPASSVKPVFEYDKAFPLPADYLHVVTIPALDALEACWSVERHQDAPAVLANCDAPLELVYIKRVTDPQRFSPLFIQALVYLIANEIAPLLTQSAVKSERAMALYERAMEAAMTRDGQESGVIHPQVPSWLRVREQEI